MNLRISFTIWSMFKYPRSRRQKPLILMYSFSVFSYDNQSVKNMNRSLWKNSWFDLILVSQARTCVCVCVFSFFSVVVRWCFYDYDYYYYYLHVHLSFFAPSAFHSFCFQLSVALFLSIFFFSIISISIQNNSIIFHYLQCVTFQCVMVITFCYET